MKDRTHPTKTADGAEVQNPQGRPTRLDDKHICCLMRQARIADVMETGVMIIVLLANACLVGAGIYLSAYLKRKAEGLATKEDFRDLKEQTAELTRTTKKIEAEIDEDVWDRQKRWELRRDVMFQAVKAVGAAKDTLTTMHAVFMTDKRNAEQGKPIRADKEAEVYAAFNKSADELGQIFMLASISCGDAVRDKLGEFGLFVREMAVEIADRKPEKFLEQKDQLATLYTDVAKAIRAEMEPKKKLS